MLKKYTLIFTWVTAWIATLGSLFFSEVLKYPPCTLCWYQRIAMYPLVVILFVGIWKKDKNAVWYGLPLALIGWVIALYHSLLYYGLIPQPIGACANGVSCTSEQVLWFGFVSIPLLSFVAFTMILLGLFTFIKQKDA